MAALRTLEDAQIVVRNYFPTACDAASSTKRTVFAPQIDIDHRNAAGQKERVGYVEDEIKGKVWVWALLVWDEGIVFYKGSERIEVSALKYVYLQEPARTLVG